MTTAPENRGGANGGPQYNPANVNGLGGNGQSGEASGFKYGMNKTINDQRQMGNAAVASTANVRSASAIDVPQGAPQEPVTELFAASQRPNEDIMAGNRLGPGPGPEALMMQNAAGKLSDVLAKMIPYDTTGEIIILYQDALAKGN